MPEDHERAKRLSPRARHRMTSYGIPAMSRQSRSSVMRMAPDLSGSGAIEIAVLYPGDECLPLVLSHRQVHAILIRRVPHPDSHAKARAPSLTEVWFVSLRQSAGTTSMLASVTSGCREILTMGSGMRKSQAISSKSPSLTPAIKWRHSSMVNSLTRPEGSAVLPISTKSPLRATCTHWPLSQVREIRQSRSSLDIALL